jgi:hypothetical protein
MVKEWDVLKAGFAREISHGGEAKFSCRRMGGRRMGAGVEGEYPIYIYGPFEVRRSKQFSRR